MAKGLHRRARAGDAPPAHRTETEAALSEKRRACFVGVCRAETHITLTRIEQYRGFRKPPSIFLEEMGIDPLRLIVCGGTICVDA